MMNNYWCEICGKRWQKIGDETSITGNIQEECPQCGERFDIRKTMSPEEAEERGLK
jgi:ribosome-binding protein aMBF1 (putative translation factor)